MGDLLLYFPCTFFRLYDSLPPISFCTSNKRRVLSYFLHMNRLPSSGNPSACPHHTQLLVSGRECGSPNFRSSSKRGFGSYYEDLSSEEDDHFDIIFFCYVNVVVTPVIVLPFLETSSSLIEVVVYCGAVHRPPAIHRRSRY